MPLTLLPKDEDPFSGLLRMGELAEFLNLPMSLIQSNFSRGYLKPHVVRKKGKRLVHLWDGQQVLRDIEDRKLSFYF